DDGYFASAASAACGYGDYAGMADDARDTFRRRLALVERHVGGGRILAVGACYGYLTEVAGARFPERWGVQRPASAAARGPESALRAVTPNGRSWLARGQGHRWVSLKFPEHVVLFSEATLRRTLETAGFRVETIVPAGQYARLDFLATRVASGFPRAG